jgi:hypothetical protein
VHLRHGFSPPAEPAYSRAVPGSEAPGTRERLPWRLEAILFLFVTAVRRRERLHVVVLLLQLGSLLRQIRLRCVVGGRRRA